MIIYKAVNKINDMSYIGQTVNSLDKRIKEHLINSRRNTLYFNRALHKYGEDVFSWNILKECFDIKELNIWEKFFIRQYKTKTPHGYNLTDGGEGIQGLKRTKEHKRKISESRQGEKHWMYGKHLSDKHKQKISKTLKGHSVSEKTRRKIGKGNSIALKGKRLPKERREKLINSTKKDFFVQNINSGEQFIIRGLRQFCREHNLSLSSMRRILYGIQKQGHHQGWIIKYMEV